MNSLNGTRHTTALFVPEIAETGLATQDTPPDVVQRILAAFFAGKSPLTLKAYAGDIQDYARFLGVDGPAGASVQKPAV